MTKHGLKQHLQRATTRKEVNDLLTIGAAFDNASDDTRRKWKRIADNKLKELQPTVAKGAV